MNHKHFRQILLANNIVPQTLSETKIALKLVVQKEKFILEDASKALLNNKNNIFTNGKYTLHQYIDEIHDITHRYYALYIEISQFESFFRTFVNHKMIKAYGTKWHQHSVVNDIKDFTQPQIQNLTKSSKALNAISFGTLEVIFLNGSRYSNVFEQYIKKSKILTSTNKPKYNNKKEIKTLFSIVRNTRNDICHHRRIGESIKSNLKYNKNKMTLSEVTRALSDLKKLLSYDDRFDVKKITFGY